MSYSRQILGVLALGTVLLGCRPVSTEGIVSKPESCSPIANVSVPYGSTRLEGGNYAVSDCNGIALIVAPNGRRTYASLEGFYALGGRKGPDGLNEQRIDFVDNALSTSGGVER